MRVIVVGLAAALGCGGPESSSSFTTCEQSSTCRAGVCTIVEACQIDECQSELTYEFAGEEFESTCTFGPTRTTTTYPLDGGPGTTRIEQNLEECFYKVEVEFNDVDEERRCTVTDECTLQELSCGPSAPGDPDCSVVAESPCR